MADEMSRATLRVAYDGPALRDGRMDVRDLAPALLAIGDLCEESFRLLHGTDKRLRVEVTAGFKKGSFGITLDIAGFWPAIREMFAGPDATAVANLISIVGLGGTAVLGLVQLTKKLNGRKPDRVIRSTEKTVRVEIGNESFIVAEEVVKLYADVKIRNALTSVMAPVTREGIDTFESRDESGKALVVVRKSEVDAFGPPSVVDMDVEPPIVDTTTERAFGLISLTFKDDNKWRLSDGDGSIYATIEDPVFLDRVDRREVSFTKGDVLRCRVRFIQYRSSGGVKNEYRVLEVLEHIPAPRQTLLQLPPKV